LSYKPDGESQTPGGLRVISHAMVDTGP